MHTKCYILKAKIKYYNVIIDRKNFFDQPIKNDLKTYDNIRNIAAGERNGYTTGCLLNCLYFKEHCKLIEIDLGKQERLDANPKAIYHINFDGNPEKNVAIFFIIEEAKETVSNFSKQTVKVL